MAQINTTDTIGVNLLAKTNQFTVAMDKASQLMVGFGKVTNKAAEQLAKFEAFALGAGLALLFTGMAIKNAAQQALTATIKTFGEVTEGTMLYNQSIGRLAAAFEFLKFSIADAFLTSALGVGLLEVVIAIFDFISGTSDGFKALIAGGLVFLVILGGVMMIAGQILLFSLLFTAALKLAAGSVVIKLALGLVGVLGAIGLLVVAFLLFVGFMKMAPAEVQLKFFKAFKAIGNFIEVALLSPLLAVLAIIDAASRFLGFGGLDLEPLNKKLDTSVFDPKIASLEQEVAANRAAAGERESGTEKGTIFNIENINANNAEEFVTSLKETSLFNKGAGIG
jgi:hypothetical protein